MSHAAASVKCFACEFNRNACPVLGGCPSNRDRCSVRHFNHWTTPVVDCPGEYFHYILFRNRPINCYNNRVSHDSSSSLSLFCLTAGCQTFLVTDPVGDIIVWKRGCSNQLPTGSRSNICTTEYVMGSFRVDSCVCNRYLCNGSKGKVVLDHREARKIISSTLLTCFFLIFFTSFKQLF